MTNLDIGIKVLVGYQQLHDREPIVCYRPVDGETLIIILDICELGVCLGLISERDRATSKVV